MIPYILTNPHALGLTDYCVFFNYSGEEKQARNKIIQFCLTSQRVAYFAELTGAFQYSVSLFCRTVFEVAEFFEELGELLPRSSFETSNAIRMQFTQLLGRWSNDQATPVTLDRTRVETESAIDDHDRAILSYYSQHAAAPLKEVAKTTGLSETAVRYRLISLEKRRIIHSYAYLVAENKLGMTSFRIIIAARGRISDVHAELYKFMLSHPRSSGFVRCMGAWDFELTFLVQNTEEIGVIIGDVTERFARSIRTTHTLNEISVLRGHHFPMLSGNSIQS